MNDDDDDKRVSVFWYSETDKTESRSLLIDRGTRGDGIESDLRGIAVSVVVVVVRVKIRRGRPSFVADNNIIFTVVLKRLRNRVHTFL